LGFWGFGNVKPNVKADANANSKPQNPKKMKNIFEKKYMQKP